MDIRSKIIILAMVIIAGCAIAQIYHLHAELKSARHPLYHRHADVRQFMIRAALDEVQSPIVILGDSIAEMARFPDAACGHPVINAGIGGASTSDFLKLAPALLDGRSPYLIVVALGANDVGSSSLTSDLSSLLSMLVKLATDVTVVSSTQDPAVVSQQRAATAAMGIPFREITVTGMMDDGIHFNATGYRQWLPDVIEAMKCKNDALQPPTRS